jgi:predicted nucleotidyltransferase
MATDSLRTLARHLDVPERTLRRAAAQGLLRGERTSERRYRTTLREEAYLREHWSLLGRLRDALRTEPNVRLAVLFGSFATGDDSERSDIDLLVALRDPSAAALAGVAGRLSDRLGRDVQLVRVQESEQSPVLMADVLGHGRVLVDRDTRWESMKADERRWRRRAARSDVALATAMQDLGRP